MILLGRRLCPAPKFLLSKKRSAEYFAQKYPRLLFQLPRSTVLLYNVESRKPQYRNSGPRGNTRGPNSRGVMCYYCRKPKHVIQDCKKLQNQNQRFSSAYIASSNEASDQSVQYQESLNSPSTLVTAIVVSGNLNTCLVSSSSSE